MPVEGSDSFVLHVGGVSREYQGGVWGARKSPWNLGLARRPPPPHPTSHIPSRILHPTSYVLRPTSYDLRPTTLALQTLATSPERAGRPSPSRPTPAKLPLVAAISGPVPEHPPPARSRTPCHEPSGVSSEPTAGLCRMWATVKLGKSRTAGHRLLFLDSKKTRCLL